MGSVHLERRVPCRAQDGDDPADVGQRGDGPEDFARDGDDEDGGTEEREDDVLALLFLDFDGDFDDFLHVFHDFMDHEDGQGDGVADKRVPPHVIDDGVDLGRQVFDVFQALGYCLPGVSDVFLVVSVWLREVEVAV